MVFFTAGGPVWMEILIFVVFAVASIVILRGLTGTMRGFDACGDGGLPPGKRGHTFSIPPVSGRACSNPLCRHVNRHAARFCSQCGQRLA